MAAGLAVIGWRTGNLPYLAGDDEAAMVQPGDVPALSRSLNGCRWIETYDGVWETRPMLGRRLCRRGPPRAVCSLRRYRMRLAYMRAK